MSTLKTDSIREYLKTQPVQKAWLFGSLSRNFSKLWKAEAYSLDFMEKYARFIKLWVTSSPLSKKPPHDWHL